MPWPSSTSLGREWDQYGKGPECPSHGPLGRNGSEEEDTELVRDAAGEAPVVDPQHKSCKPELCDVELHQGKGGGLSWRAPTKV